MVDEDLNLTVSPLHVQWMREALKHAQAAADAGEVPIGCVIVNESTGQILAGAGNRRQGDRDPTAHAEILALRAAGQAIGHWRLCDCTLVVTLEPCPMCAGAIVNARIVRVIYGCADPKAGAIDTLYSIARDERLNHRAEIVSGVLADECAAVLRQFFQAQRALGKK